MPDLVEPKINARLRFKFPPIGIKSYQSYDAVVILIDKSKDLYRVRSLHTNKIEDFNLTELNQSFIILTPSGRYGD
jgi:hypothetical protein